MSGNFTVPEEGHCGNVSHLLVKATHDSTESLLLT